MVKIYNTTSSIMKKDLLVLNVLSRQNYAAADEELLTSITFITYTSVVIEISACVLTVQLTSSVLKMTMVPIYSDVCR